MQFNSIMAITLGGYRAGREHLYTVCKILGKLLVNGPLHLHVGVLLRTRHITIAPFLCNDM